MTSVKQIFVNFPVSNIERSVDFFTRLGFVFDADFQNDRVAAMTIGENMYGMFFVNDFYDEFIPGKQVADASQVSEGIVGLSFASREEVDALIDKAVAAGGSEYRETADYPNLYARAFQDPDGHIWEALCTDPTQSQDP